MPPFVYLIRHGQTPWNIEGRLQGQRDTDLTDEGRRQAERNGRRLQELVADPDAFDFVSSPLKRTSETMRIVRGAMGLEPDDFRRDDRLVEISFGDWEGHTFLELEKQTPGITKARSRDKWNYVPPGEHGESYQMLFDRIRPWFEAIAKPTVAVTHGGVIRAIFRLIEDVPAQEAATLEIRQDRLVRYQDGRLTWM